MTERHRLKFRESRPGEAASLARSGSRSFRSATPELWQSYFEAREVSPPDTLVVEVDGVTAGHATMIPLTMSLAGRDVPMRGVAAVAVLPEFRRRGVADALMRECLKRMRRRGEALSLLYAFRMSFYRKFGYGVSEWADHVRVAPAQLPASPLRRRVRVLDRVRDQREVRRVYEASRGGRTGPLKRSAEWWEMRVFKRAPDGGVYVNPATRRMEGYLLYDVPVDPPYPRQQLLVRELVAVTPEAFRGLLGFLEAQGDQFKLIEIAMPRGQAVGLLTDFGLVGVTEALRLFQTTGLASGGAMTRLVDVTKALALHPAPAKNGARGKIGLDLEDPVFPAQSRGFDVSFGARGARALPGRSARDRLALPVASLAGVYMAGSSARTLLAQGFATGSRRAAELLDEAFAGPPTFLYPLNGF